MKASLPDGGKTVERGGAPVWRFRGQCWRDALALARRGAPTGGRAREQSALGFLKKPESRGLVTCSSADTPYVLL